MNSFKIILSKEDYLKCLWFALRLWYAKKDSRIYYGMGTKRDAVSYITSMVRGKLAELSFAKFLSKELGLRVEPDFTIKRTREKISDIYIFLENGRKKLPKIKINIIATSPNSKFLLIERRTFLKTNYDAYVLIFVDLPRDHLIRLALPMLNIKGELKVNIGEIRTIKTEIFGFVWSDEVKKKAKLVKKNSWLRESNKAKSKIFLLRSDNYVLPISLLKRSENEWKKLIDKVFLSN